jgi:Flp pilus assembly protein TadD
MKPYFSNTVRVAIALGCTALTGCANPPGFDVPHASRQSTSGQLVADDNSIETLVRLGDFTMSRGQIPAAISLYRRAHAAAPDRPLPLEKLGRALATIGSHDEAAGAFRSLLEINPVNPIGLRGLGNAYLALNEPDLALPNLEAAVAVGDDASSYSSLGVALDMSGRHQDALDAYESALHLAPGDLDIATNMAISLSLSDRHDEAVQLMRRTASSPTATVRHRQNLALIYGLANRTDDARATARIDMDERSVERSLAYYAMLQRIEDSRRRAAAIGDSSGARLEP